MHKRLLKVIILGDTGIGKSCILTRLTKDFFDTEHNVTVGVDFGSCLIKVEDTIMKLQIWDAVILGYSITDRSTFDNLKNWMREVRD